MLKHMPTLDAPPVACGKSAWSGGPHLTVAYAFDEGSLEGPSRLAPRLSAFRDDGTAAENSDQLPLLLVHVFAPGCMWELWSPGVYFQALVRMPAGKLAMSAPAISMPPGQQVGICRDSARGMGRCRLLSTNQGLRY